MEGAADLVVDILGWKVLGLPGVGAPSTVTTPVTSDPFLKPPNSGTVK